MNKAAVLAFFLALVPTTSAQPTLPPAFAKPVPETIDDLKAIEKHVQKLADKLIPATVCIRVGTAQGSGVIIDRDGRILTAGHVSGASGRDAVIILHDGQQLKGGYLERQNAIAMCMMLQ